MKRKITDLEKFCLEHIIRPYQGFEWLKKYSEKTLDTIPCSQEELLRRLKENSEWSKVIINRICGIDFTFSDYIQHPIKDFIEKKIKEFKQSK